MSFNGLLGLFLLNELQNADAAYREKVQRRLLRERSDPFAMPNTSFVATYRLSKELVNQLIIEVGPHLQANERITAIPIYLKIFTALYFFANGCYQKGVGQNLHINMKQPTVSGILTEISDAMVDHVINRWIIFPKKESEQRNIQQNFLDKTGFPGVIGAIACSHIAIVAPPVDDPIRPEHAYYNSEGYHSINVQVVCDSDLRILDCNARFPGSCLNFEIWSLSRVMTYLQSEFTADRLKSSWLIGDLGYPLQPWLLTSIENAKINSPESRYNEAHVRACNCTERCFGLLKNRFRCLLKPLYYDPVKAAKIIYSCAILHNMALKAGLEEPEVERNEIQRDNHNKDAKVPTEKTTWLAEGRKQRNRVVQNFL